MYKCICLCPAVSASASVCNEEPMDCHEAPSPVCMNFDDAHMNYPTATSSKETGNCHSFISV